MRSSRRGLVMAVAAALAALGGCSSARTVERTLTAPPPGGQGLAGLDGKSPYLKAHLPDGGLYLLSEWSVPEPGRSVHGTGARLGPGRQVAARGRFEVPIDSVAIFETNVLQSSALLGGMAVVTVASLSLTAYCIANPKACFGSCPTFYAPAAEGPLLMAEGFSASVAPALEASDLDALYRCAPSGSRLELVMTNEALETHVVRRADLLAAPRPEGGRVLAAPDGRLWRAARLQAPRRAVGPEGDCAAALAAPDGQERCSLADSADLATREIIELEFDRAPDGPLGLAIASRHSLMSTFLFYQTLAYLGRHAVPLLGRAAAMATAAGAGPGSGPGAAGQPLGIGALLGRIEVLVPDGAGGWRQAGEVGETGPLATNVHLLPLPPLDPRRPAIRLRLTKGNWRLDWVALAALAGEAVPVRLRPVEVLREGLPDPEALASLLDEGRTLVTYPGDRYTLVYELPPGPGSHELFLESRGWYLEWMRQEWLDEEDPAAAAMVLMQPALALRKLAPAFKAMEPGMEAHFWGSRYARGM